MSAIRLLAVFLLLAYKPLPSAATITFTETPQDVLIAVGSTASFTCQFTSSNSASVQWQKDGVSLIPSSRISFNSTALIISPTMSGDAGLYSCVVTDQVLEVSHNRSANLTFAYILDSFLISPESTDAMAGTAVTLFCVHSGSLPAAQMSWVKDGATLSSSGSITITTGVLQHATPPQTSSSVSISPVSDGDAGQYECVATNSLLPGSPVRSSMATLTVSAELASPVITNGPSSLILLSAGTTATLECSTTGEPIPTISWQFAGANIDTSLSKISVFSSGGNSTLTITNFQNSDVGDYRCVASNSQGTNVSNNATVEIAYIEQSFQSPPQDTFALLGQDGIIDCTPPRSTPPPMVTWFRDSVLVSGSQFSVAANGSLIISSATFNNEGDYVCVANNELIGITRSSPSAQFSVYVFPTIDTASQDLQLSQGSNFTLFCNSSGTPQPNVTWYKDNSLISNNNPSHLRLVEYSLTVFNAQVADEGAYRCIVSNPAGSVQEDINIDVIPFPVTLVDHTDIAVVVSSPVLIPCYIQEDPSLNITWTFNSAQLTLPFPGFQLLSNGSLLVQTVAHSQEGLYSCTGTNTLGAAMASVRLEVQVAPTVSVSESSLTRTQGQTVQLVCTVTGDPTPSVQWYHNGETRVPNALTPNAQLSSNDTVLRLSPVLKRDEGEYVCVVSNNQGSVNSSISLIVEVAPSISATPISQTVLERDMRTVEFSCTAPGDPQPTIAWLTSNMVDVLLLGNERLEVLTDSTLRIVNATVEDNGRYVCQGTNSAGTASATVTLNVYDVPSVSLLPYLNATQGSHVTLDCDVTGYPDPVVTWYKDGSVLVTNDRLTIENNSITIDSALSTDSGAYTCSASNIAGNRSATIELTVLVLPLIIVPDPIVPANIGSNAQLVCNAMGDPTPSLTWYFGSVPIPNPSLPRYSVDSNYTLIISNVVLSDEGSMFVCQASNDAGIESATVSLTVNIAPNITALYPSLTVVQGNGAVLYCTVTAGRPFPLITWYSNDTAIARDRAGFQYISNGQTLVIGNVMKSHEDVYTCRAVNVAGISEDYVDLTVNVPPSFSPPISDSAGIEGTVHVLECAVEGDPTPVVQWSQGGLVFPSGSRLTFSSLSRTNAGTYTCTATNIAGSASQDVVLDVYYLPSITASPSSISVPISTSGSFNCTATGNPQTGYHWLYNGQIIPGAESSSYTVPSVSSTDGGVYSCVATNVVGSVTSNATLTVLFPPSSPSVTRVLATGSHSLSVTWTSPSSDGGTPVTSYTIEYRPSTSNDSYSSTSVSANVLSYGLTGLLSYTEYDVRLRAVNIAGTSPPSDVYTPAVRTHPGSPLPPNNLTFTFTPPSSLTVSWDPPLQFNGQFGVYEILVTNWDDLTIQFDRVLFVTMSTVPGLLSDATYRVQVRAGTIGIDGAVLWGPYIELWILNGNEVSPPSMSTTIAPMTTTSLVATTTSVAMTTSSVATTPSSVAMTTSSVAITTSSVAMTTSSVVMTTSSVAMTTSSVATATSSIATTATIISSAAPMSSSVSSSMVSVSTSEIMTSSGSASLTPTSTGPALSPSSSAGSSSQVSVPATSATTLVVATSITPSTTLALTPFSSLATDTPSSIALSPSVSPSPLPDPPSVAPINLQLTSPAAGIILAQWFLPVMAGEFDGFHVYVSPPPPLSANITLPITLGSFDLQASISGLANEVEYNISVALFNEGGDGPSVTNSIQTPPGPPSPPLGVTAQASILFREIQVSWLPPENIGGTLFTYFVVLTNTIDGSIFSQTISVPAPAQSFPFSTIFTQMPDGLYEITVSAENENGVGLPSDIITVSLFENPPEMTSSSVVATSSSVGMPLISSTLIEISSVISSTAVASSSSVAVTSSSAAMTSSSVVSSPTPSVTLPDPPAVSPSGLSLLVPSFGQIIASWQIPQGDYDGFHVYISPPVTGLSLPITLSPDTTVHIFNGLENGLSYTVNIAAYNEGGDGPLVSESIQTLGGVPDSPTNIQVIGNPQAGYIQVSWGPPANPAGTLSEYRVYAQDADNALVTEIVTVSPSSQNADFNVLLFVPPHEYTITIEAVNQYGTGDLSPPINVSLIIISSSTSLSSTSTVVATSSSIVTSSVSITSSSVMSSSIVMLSSSVAALSSSSLYSPSPSRIAPTIIISTEAEPSVSPSIIVGTTAPSPNVAAIVIPVILVILILILVIVGVMVLLYCYRNPRRRKMLFKMSPSQAEMSYELMPAPLPEKGSPRQYTVTPLDKKSPPPPKPEPYSKFSSPPPPPPPPFSEDQMEREALEESSSSDEEERKMRLEKQQQEKEKQEHPLVVLRKQQQQQQQPGQQGGAQQPRLQQPGPQQPRQQPQGGAQQPRQQQPGPGAQQQPRQPPLTKKEQEALRKQQEKRQKELKKKQEKRQKELKKQQEQRRKELIKRQEQQKKQRQIMIQQKYKQQMQQQQMRQQQQRQQQMRQQGRPQQQGQQARPQQQGQQARPQQQGQQARPQQQGQQARPQQQGQQARPQQGRPQQQDYGRQKSKDAIPYSQIPKVIPEDEEEQPVIQTQPQRKKDEDEKEIQIEKQEKETEETKDEGDRTSSLLGEYSMLDQQFMDVEPVQIPMDTPLIPPSSKAPSETSEDTIRRPSFDPGEYSYAELDSIRAKKTAAREAQLRKEQAGGRGGGAVGGGPAMRGRGGPVMRGRGGPVMRGRGGPVMRGRGGVVMRGGVPMRRQQEPEKRRSFLSRLTSSQPKQEKQLSRSSQLSGRGMAYGNTLGMMKSSDDIY